MRTNKGNKKLINNKETKIESLANSVLRGDFLKIGALASDACRLMVQFNAEGYIAVREQFDENERNRQCNLAVEWAAETLYSKIIPSVFESIVYGQEEEWKPVSEEATIIGLYDDVLVFYLEGLPLAMAIFSAEEYQPDLDELSEEDVAVSEPSRLEQIEAIYVDDNVVSRLNLSNDMTGVYVEMLISKAVERFSTRTDEKFRPTIAIAKNQEGYFSKMAKEHLWGKTEQEAGYIIYN